MLEVCWEHNYSNDMLLLVTDEDFYAGTAFLENKKIKKLIFLPCKKNSAKRMMFVRGIGAVPDLPRGV